MLNTNSKTRFEFPLLPGDQQHATHVQFGIQTEASDTEAAARREKQIKAQLCAARKKGAN